MGIDVYLKWPGQSKEQRDGQIFGFEVSERAGRAGYLREAYHGGPYATKVLVPESWDHEKYVEIPNTDTEYGPAEGIPINARILRERLPSAIEAAKERARVVYHDPTGDTPMVNALTAFVELAEDLQRHDIQPYIDNSY